MDWVLKSLINGSRKPLTVPLEARLGFKPWRPEKIFCSPMLLALQVLVSETLMVIKATG